MDTTLASSQITFLLIRHGETHWNKEKKWQGHADIALNETGIKQAKQTAQKLLNDHPDIQAIYASDLSRAHHTALETAEVLKLPVQLNPTFREFRMGEGEGKTLQEVDKEYGTTEEFVKKYPNKLTRWNHTRIPGAEPTNHLLQRLKKGLEEIASQYSGGKVAVFTHGGCIHALIAELQDTDIHKLQVPNCAILELLYNPTNDKQLFQFVKLHS